VKIKYLIPAISVPALVAIDQLTKWLARLYLRPLQAEVERSDRYLTVIDGFFRLKYAENAGAAWGLGNSWSPGVRVPFFIAVTLLAIGFIVYFLRKLPDAKRLLPIGFGLVLAGAIGNLIDRATMTRVVDFIDWYVAFSSPWDLGLFTLSAGEHHWPTFNVADICITFGVALLFVDLLFGKKLEGQAQDPSPPGKDR
jgi:signal peptidase II